MAHATVAIAPIAVYFPPFQDRYSFNTSVNNVCQLSSLAFPGDGVQNCALPEYGDGPFGRLFRPQQLADLAASSLVLVVDLLGALVVLIPLSGGRRGSVRRAVVGFEVG